MSSEIRICPWNLAVQDGLPFPALMGGSLVLPQPVVPSFLQAQGRWFPFWMEKEEDWMAAGGEGAGGEEIEKTVIIIYNKWKFLFKHFFLKKDLHQSWANCAHSTSISHAWYQLTMEAYDMKRISERIWSLCITEFGSTNMHIIMFSRSIHYPETIMIFFSKTAE